MSGGGGFGQVAKGGGGNKARKGAGFGQKSPNTKAASAKQETEQAPGAGATTATNGDPHPTRNMVLQFTCNRCGAVNQYRISKQAYEEGVVICTCRTCEVRHLIADNLGKLDFPEFGRNIEEFMAAQGSEGTNQVTRATAPNLNPEVLAKYNLLTDDDGTLSLSPKGGGET